MYYNTVMIMHYIIRCELPLMIVSTNVDINKS